MDRKLSSFYKIWTVVKKASKKKNGTIVTIHFHMMSLYPRHLCRWVYSFRLSVRPFVCSFVRSFVRTSVTFVEFASKFYIKVSQAVYISATTYQKAFIFGP